MRFDDSLDTVLAAEMSSPAGVQSSWRQIVDLIGRGRAPAGDAAITRLRAIRDDVPAAVRAASARGLERASPPAALAALFVDDELAIAAPVVRSVTLSASEWIALLPTMRPATRGLLRNRRDLGPEVTRALESFGPTDLVLPGVVTTRDDIGAPADEIAEPEDKTDTRDAAVPAYLPAPEAEPVALDGVPALVDEPAPFDEPPVPIQPENSFVAVADIARELPVVAEAMRLADEANATDAEPEPPVATPRPEPTPQADPVPAPGMAAGEADAAPPWQPLRTVDRGLRALWSGEARRDKRRGGAFKISDLVARIEAHQRRTDDGEVAPLVWRSPAEAAAPGAGSVASPPAQPAAPAERFDFETDAAGTIRWVDGVERGAVIGVTLDPATSGASPQIDGVAAGAFRRRAEFADGRLEIGGRSNAAGGWRISATPAFDRATGRFTGYRGSARRPRADEQPGVAGSSRSDSLRQLVHELRTPTNAIAGFAEMIEAELLGPVAPVYRERAMAIRTQTLALLGAIEDLDVAARIESRGLDLRAASVATAPLLDRIIGDLQSLAALRGAVLTLDGSASPARIAGDDRAVERLLSRLLTALMATAAPGERIGVRVGAEAEMVCVTIDRPRAFAPGADTALFSADAEVEAESPGAPLLGIGFAYRLARNLTAELGGSLAVGTERLTLRLPAAVDRVMEQATL